MQSVASGGPKKKQYGATSKRNPGMLPCGLSLDCWAMLAHPKNQMCIGCQRQPVRRRFLSRDHISKTEQDRPTVIMEQ